MHPNRIIWRAVALTCLLVAGCGQAESDSEGVEAALSLKPSPPVVGDAEVLLRLTDKEGSLLEGADVRLEGNMNHAGMKPSFADLEEVQPGLYTGTLDFTMAGDWFILITAKLPDGREVEHKIDVPGVEAP